MKQIFSRSMIFSLAFSACLMLAVANHHASAAMLGEVQSWKQDGKAVTFVCGKSLVRLEFWADDVVRVTLLSGGKSNPGSKHDVLLALEGCYGAPPALSITDGEAVRIATQRLTVRVDKQSFRLHFLKPDGKTPITRNPERATLDTDLCPCTHA